MRRRACPGDGAQDPPGDERAGGSDEHDDYAPSREQDRPQLREVIAQGLLGEEEVELHPRIRRASAGDEVRGVSDPHALERQVALPHEALHPAGDLGSTEGEPRGQHISAGERDRLEAGPQGVEVKEVSDVLPR